MHGETIAEIDVIDKNLNTLTTNNLLTHTGRRQFENTRSDVLSYYRSRSTKLLKKQASLEMSNLKSEEDFGRFAKIEPNQSARAVQTYFRSNYRNHINLSAIADNKANIMISVNSILISILLTIMTYQNLYQTKPFILLPVVVFLVTGLTSLTFAILSSRPKVNRFDLSQLSREKRKGKLVYFGNFSTLSEDEFIEDMDALFEQGHELYESMLRDLYHLGKVLDKKYRYLSASYNIFMGGFITTVFAFLVLFFT